MPVMRVKFDTEATSSKKKTPSLEDPASLVGANAPTGLAGENAYLTQAAAEAQGLPTEGLTAEQLAVLKSRAQTGNEIATRNALGGLASSLGGDTSSPLYALNAARMKAAGGSAAAAQMADIDIANTERSQELQYRRQQMLQSLAGLGAQDLAARMQYAVNLGQLGLGHRQLTEQMALGWGELAQRAPLTAAQTYATQASGAQTEAAVQDWLNSRRGISGIGGFGAELPRGALWNSIGY